MKRSFIRCEIGSSVEDPELDGMDLPAMPSADLDRYVPLNEFHEHSDEDEGCWDSE